MANSVYQVEPERTIDENDSSEESSEIGSPECMLCVQLVKEAEKNALNNKSEEHIKEVLEQACTKFRNEKLKEKCVEIVDKNADYIINAIIKNTSPKEICAVLGLCIGQHVAPMQTLTKSLEAKLADTPQCVICELIMTRLETELKDKKTQDEIRDAVESICTKLPKSVAPNCKQFVKQYSDLIITLLSTLPPKQLCGEMNLCLTNQIKDVAQG